MIRGSLEELVIMIDAGELIGFCYADMKFKKNIGEVWTWVVACPICGKQHRYPAQSFQINEDWIIERVPSLCDETKELILLKKSWKRRLATVGTITNRKSIPARVKKMIYRRSGGRCWYCGDQLVRHGFFHGEIDHVRPIALGGDNDPDNLVAACHSCNSAKGDKTLSAFRKIRGGDLFWHERQEWEAA